MLDSVWIFCDSTGRLASGAFGSRELAEEWINRHQFSGILTRYPLNEGVYDWCVRTGRFTPTKEYQTAGQFIGRFTSVSQEHYHYETGINLTA